MCMCVCAGVWVVYLCMCAYECEKRESWKREGFLGQEISVLTNLLFLARFFTITTNNFFFSSLLQKWFSKTGMQNKRVIVDFISCSFSIFNVNDFKIITENQKINWSKKIGSGGKLTSRTRSPLISFFLRVNDF